MVAYPPYTFLSLSVADVVATVLAATAAAATVAVSLIMCYAVLGTTYVVADFYRYFGTPC